MDELITKPLKRLLANSKSYAKQQISGLYGYSRQETIRMSDTKTVLSSPKVKYVNSSTSEETSIGSQEGGRILFNESFIPNTEISGISPLSDRSDNTNRTDEEATRILESCEELSSKSQQETNVDNRTNTFDTGKTRKSLIKVKVIIPKGSTNNQADETIAADEGPCIFEENQWMPLSPIRPVSESANSATFRHSVPIMGKTALLARNHFHTDKAAQHDSEIISCLVRDRFTCRTNKFTGRSPGRLSTSNNVQQSSPKKENGGDVSYDKVSLYEDEKDLEVQYRSDVSGYGSGSTVAQQDSLHGSTHTSNDIFQVSEDLPSGGTSQRKLSSRSQCDTQEVLNKVIDYQQVPRTSPEVTPQKNKKFPKIIQPEDSICTSDASDLVSKVTSLQSSVYHSLTKKLRNISSSVRKTSPGGERLTMTDDELSSYLPNNERVTELVRQAAVQYETMKQLSKVLNFCRNTKEFSCSAEQLEGERLLLLAIHKRQALLNEIRKLDYELVESSNSLCSTGTGIGTVVLSGLRLPVKQSAESGECQRKIGELRHWYVCLVSQGTQVLATEPQLANQHLAGYVTFPEQFTFDQLPSDFVITVEVYSLLQRRASRNFSHDSKFHLNGKCSSCPTPRKLLQKHTQRILSDYENGVECSAFKLKGVLRLKVYDVRTSGPWPLRKVPSNSSLAGSVELQVCSRALVPVKHSGFLTVGQLVGGCTAWNRRWCVLNGPLCSMWNYPCEEDVVDALQTLDLRRCASARVQPASRTLCPRPRTLLLQLWPLAARTTYFLAADTLADMRHWEARFNQVIAALRIWNDCAHVQRS